ncbi:hypothetical protein BP422_13200 [Brevibacillus formosus]|uniref:Uncharacterized protein n=1 Tax=Brevibacillus formosus TaxID=54913 RepID=A0A220MIM9_9BACL|nr:hypothetical protein BP422_13200 [Brevibacillus formosus]
MFGSLIDLEDLLNPRGYTKWYWAALIVPLAWLFYGLLCIVYFGNIVGFLVVWLVSRPVKWFRKFI